MFQALYLLVMHLEGHRIKKTKLDCSRIRLFWCKIGFYNQFETLKSILEPMTNSKSCSKYKVGVHKDICNNNDTSTFTQCGPVYCNNRFNLFSGPFLVDKCDTRGLKGLSKMTMDTFLGQKNIPPWCPKPCIWLVCLWKALKGRKNDARQQ